MIPLPSALCTPVKGAGRVTPGTTRKAVAPTPGAASTGMSAAAASHGADLAEARKKLSQLSASLELSKQSAQAHQLRIKALEREALSHKQVVEECAELRAQLQDKSSELMKLTNDV